MILLSRHQWYLEFNKVLEFSTFLSSKEEVFGSVEQYLSSKEEVFDSVEQYLSQKWQWLHVLWDNGNLFPWNNCPNYWYDDLKKLHFSKTSIEISSTALPKV